MQKAEENISLKPYNTFGMDVKARWFVRIKSVEDIKNVLQNDELNKMPRLIIGGGSNILLCKDFDGLVIKNEITGIEKIKEDENFVWINTGAGENWHSFVMHCIENNWAGIENLSLIPGCVGAAPMQNIGAYGVEVKDVITDVFTVRISDAAETVFQNEKCAFAYRESIFKNSEKDKHIITSVTFKLKKNPEYKITYGAIADELKKEPDTPLSIRKISNAVIRIRQSKLPDPAVIGNAGSFFKNPEVENAVAEKLKNNFPEIVTYNSSEGKTKIAAGWLIENAGWKGFTENNFGVHKLQALVLVNYGGATGKDIYNLSEKIIRSVKDKFGIELQREVNLYP